MRRVNKGRFVTMIFLKFYFSGFDFLSSISRSEYKYGLSKSANVVFFTGVKPPPQKKVKLSKTNARYEKENRK